MTAALTPRRVNDPQCIPLLPATKNRYLQWLEREVSPNEGSVFGFHSDGERISAIADSLREVGVVIAQRPKTAGEAFSPSKEKARALTPERDDWKISSRYQTFAAATVSAATPRPKSANPKLMVFSKNFVSAFPVALVMSMRDQMALFQNLRELLVQPMLEIQQSATAYANKHSWDKTVHLEIGCALLHGLQSALGVNWDPDGKIKNAWAAAYHFLIFGSPKNKQTNSSHVRAPSRHKLKAYGGMVRPTKTPFSPTSKPSRTLGLSLSEPPQAIGVASAPENKTTQTSSPTTTPPSNIPFVPPISQLPSSESCCVIL